jgi:hypothetical protein
METFAFGSDPALKATFHSKRYASSGWLDSYAIEVEAIDFHAKTRVANPGHGHPPSVLFEELAVNWKGWKGAMTWLAMEGELELRATCDHLGHITVAVAIPAYANTGNWSAQARVLVEAGQLERLAIEARAFFARRDA